MGVYVSVRYVRVLFYSSSLVKAARSDKSSRRSFDIGCMLAGSCFSVPIAIARIEYQTPHHRIAQKQSPDLEAGDSLVVQRQIPCRGRRAIGQLISTMRRDS